MARPKVPLISRRRALEAALEIIDRDGLEGLSIRCLAEKLGVNGASLYHHFTNKEQIVVGAAELALANVRTPQESTEGWREWLPRNARGLREALVRHPALLPVIVGRRMSGMGAGMLDTSAARLMAEGLASSAVLPVLNALELFAVGSALHRARGDEGGYDPDMLAPRYPAFAKALRERGLSSDEIFNLVTTGILESVERVTANAAEPEDEMVGN